MNTNTVELKYPPEPLDESEITRLWSEEGTRLWSEEGTRPLVSIICHTYNHARYVKDALNGFLMQRTNFPFEIIIHDDCSSDSTQSVIKEYADKYQKIIRPIFQDENQYSKGISPGSITFPLIKGKYVAICEGDDFWNDPLKLAHQADTLEKNPHQNLCVSSAYSLYTNRAPEIFSVHSDVDTILDCENFIINDGGYVATASLFMRREVLEHLPDWYFSEAPVGDYYLQILSSYPNGACYLRDPTCVYRRDAQGNWSSIYLKETKKIVKVRSELLKTNKLCEKELNDKKLYNAFTQANFRQFRILIKAQAELREESGIFQLIGCFLRHLEFRFIFYYINSKLRGHCP